MDASDPSTTVYPEPPRPRRRRWWLGVLIALPIGVIVYALVIFGVAVWFTTYRPLARTLPLQLAAARREGLPLDPVDLRRNPPIPDSQNAAQLYREIGSLVDVRPSSDGDAFADYLAAEPTAASTQSVKSLLLAWSAPLALVTLASQRPFCDFNRPWEQGPNVILREFAAMRSVARALAVRAIVEDTEHRPLDSLKSIDVIVRMSHHASEDPILIGTLVSVAIQALANRPFRHILAAHMDDALLMARATEVLRSFGPAPNIEHGFRGEVVFCRVTCNILRRSPDDLYDTLGSLPRRAFQYSVMVDAWEARMVAYWRSTFDILRQTDKDPLERYRRMSAYMAEQDTHSGEPTYELAGILMPVFAQAQVKILGAQARQGLRTGLLSLVDFHRQNHRFPTVAEAAALIPTDPFTGKPLVYRPQANGFILYSVGENFKDDGGTEKRPKKGDPTLDIVIQYPLPVGTSS